MNIGTRLWLCRLDVLLDDRFKVAGTVNIIPVAEVQSLIGYDDQFLLRKYILDKLELITHITRTELIDLTQPIFGYEWIAELIGYLQHQHFHLNALVPLVVGVDDF